MKNVIFEKKKKKKIKDQHIFRCIIRYNMRFQAHLRVAEWVTLLMLLFFV